MSATIIIPLLLFLFALGCTTTNINEGREDSKLGPQSRISRGLQRLLVVPVAFKDSQITYSHNYVEETIVNELIKYIEDQSYGLTKICADILNWTALSRPLSEYKVSPYNFRLDKSKIRNLIEHTMTAIEHSTEFTDYDHILIIPGVYTKPGKGYGMICYCANPGFLSVVRRDYHPRYAVFHSENGQVFRGGVFVGTQNAHLGHFAHDFLHALGGIHKSRRLVP